MNEPKTPIDILLKAAAIWCEMTGVTFDQTKFSGMAAIEASIHNSRIKSAVELDPTGFLPLVIMGVEFRKWLKDQRIRLMDALVDPKTIRTIEMSKSILNLVDDKDIVKALEAEKARFTAILSRIKKERLLSGETDESREAQDVANEDFAELMFEAYKAGAELRVDQFRKGVASTKKPTLADNIFESNSVHDFISALSSTAEEALVAMCLIRDPEEPLFSYFVIGIRNGERIYIVSDRPKSPHPLYKFRTRRPGRHQGERMDAYWFPYYLMELEVDSRGDYYVPQANYHICTAGLVEADKEVKGIKKFSEISLMKHQNILWFVMLYHLLADKFFLNDYECEDLSFTGQMVNIQSSSDSTALMVRSGGQLNLTISSTQDLAVAVDEKGKFNWSLVNMQQAYENFPVVANADILIPVAASTQEVSISADGVTTKGYAFGRDTFGTEKELTEDLLFIARYNEAKLVEAKLCQNERQRSRDIVDWFEKRVYENREFIFKAIVKGRLMAPTEKSNGFFDFSVEETNILTIQEKRSDEYYSIFNGYRNIIAPNVSNREYDKHCIVNGAKPSYVVTINVNTDAAIAILTGVSIDELPAELKGYRVNGQYSGNSILDRVDPMEDIHNPYYKLKFNVAMYLSKTGLKELKKKYGGDTCEKAK